ncbi:MAG: VanW family protein [Terriglobales bacterium]
MIAPHKLPRISPSTMLCLALPVVLFLGYWIDRPFANVMASKTISLSNLSEQQKLNIQNAAQAVDGTVVQPGEEFSFNRVVGPRTSPRGYLAAPSYVGREAPPTMGGGICLLSSALYIDALHTGLNIVERNPHMRVIHSVPAGFDATVWYGRYDLRFKNSLDCPLEVTTKYTPDALTVEIKGNTHVPNWQPCGLSWTSRLVANGCVTAEVRSTQFGKTRVVSRDLYGTPKSGVSHQ